MRNNSCIVITGAAGFIGSCMVQYLNEQGFENLILVDDFGLETKRKNWEEKKFNCIVERISFFDWLEEKKPKVDFIIHLGARTDTTEFDYEVHRTLNYNYSIEVWNYCTANQIPLVYASSAATYGDGTLGYDDNHEIIDKLQPLNPYGVSKNEFDKWALQQTNQPPFWAGIKFFNVYGPNEFHKGRMASVIWHAYQQITKNGTLKLFKSHRSDFKDGEQMRDFIYVKDLIDVCIFLMEHRKNSGIYNLGTGKARSFNDLGVATFQALSLTPTIEYVDTPADIRDKYQYFTEATMQKLRSIGYDNPFTSLEDGVEDYVQNYLVKQLYY